MLKHILVPLDGSKLAEKALEHALEVVAPEGKITLVCAVEVPDIPYYGYYPTLVNWNNETVKHELLPVARNYLEGLAFEITEKGVTAKFEATIGEPVTVITEAAKRLEVDAIVMSSHGRSGVGRFLFGSVAIKILETKVCPVLIVPQKEHVTQEKPVVVTEHVN